MRWNGIFCSEARIEGHLRVHRLGTGVVGRQAGGAVVVG